MDEVRVIRNFEIREINIVEHPFHGPWSYEDGICRGCGTGFITIVEPKEHNERDRDLRH